jgi:hypothetical protein
MLYLKEGFGDVEVWQVIEKLLSKCKALSSTPSIAKKLKLTNKGTNIIL